MYCMKCGRETCEEQIFCNICLTEMKKYPVKPGIAIQLPSKKDSHLPKKAAPRRRQLPTAEERIQKLRKRVRTLTVLWLITLLLLLATVYPTAEYFRELFFQLPGQNYTIVTDTDILQP